MLPPVLATGLSRALCSSAALVRCCMCACMLRRALPSVARSIAVPRVGPLVTATAAAGSASAVRRFSAARRSLPPLPLVPRRHMSMSSASVPLPSGSPVAPPLRVLVTFPLPPPSLALLQSHPAYPDVALDIRVAEGDMEVPERLREQLSKHAPLDGLICRPGNRVDAESIRLCGPRLRAISTLSVGFNHIDLAEASRLGIRVGHCPSTVTETTADTALALMLAAARLVIPAHDNVKSGQWGKTPFDCYHLCGQDVHGSTVGIVGLGRIGLAVAKRLTGFGCKILYCGNRPKPAEAAQVNAEYCSFDDLLRRSDFVVPQCPMNESTRHLFNAAAFDKMKRNAVFVNTTRGGVVDQTALYNALKEGKIFAAGLDVTDPGTTTHRQHMHTVAVAARCSLRFRRACAFVLCAEPLPLSDPLLTLPNCLILPHVGTATKQCRHETAAETIRNLMEQLLKEDGGTGVYCNQIAPGSKS